MREGKNNEGEWSLTSAENYSFRTDGEALEGGAKTPAVEKT